VQQEEVAFHQQTGIKFKEEASKMLHSFTEAVIAATFVYPYKT
jgi:hypothetical protein